VHLYHAVSSPAPVSELLEDPHPSNTSQTRTHFLSCLERIRAMAELHDIPAKHTHIDPGPVETALPQYVLRNSANIVVMGAVSRSYPDRAVFGYTAERLLDSITCDALIIKPPGFKSPVSRRGATPTP